MKCYYEVLEISTEANDSEIKTAYRKLALKWHPDKNLDNSQNAKEQFQEVQQAYEVLSDKHERAWYDNHREQILRGANSNFEDKSLDVFQYFTTSCFKGYGDDEQGFYTIYQKVFESIAKEDIEFMEEKEEFCEIPSFGNSQSDYDTVVSPFYNYWSGYSTKKSYAWLDPYDIREGKGDRRILKLIEKDNKKNRQKLRKERNEEIRNLVAFVRKRDKRVQLKTKQMEEKAKENRKKHERLSSQKRLEQKKFNESQQQAEWTKFHNVKSELEQIEKHLAEQFGEVLSNSEDEQSIEDIENLYCIACNKMFKNPKAFENHESSKKHKLNVEILKEAMKEEEDDNEASLTDDLEDYGDLDNSDSLENIENGSLNESNLESFDSGEDLGNEVELTDSIANAKQELENLNNEEIANETKKRKKNRKSKKAFTPDDKDDIAEVHIDLNINDSDKEFDFEEHKKQKKKSKKNAGNKSKLQTEDVIDDLSETRTQTTIEDTMNKKKKKEKKSKNEVLYQDLAEVDVEHCCVTCKNSFPSKNKLFDHLKKTGHGVPLPSNIKQQNSSNSSKKKNAKYEKN